MSSSDAALTDLNAILQATTAGQDQPPATPTGPAASVLGDIANATTPKAAASTDSLLPAADYGATDAAVHGMTFGLSDAARAGLIAMGRYLSGDSPEFDYPQAAKEMQRGREAYANRSPVANFAANLVGGATSLPLMGARAVAAASGPVGRIGAGMLTGGATGAIQGAADNSDSIGNAITGAERGGAIGAGVGAAIPAATTLVPGMTAASQALRAQGVEPAPGNAMGGLPSVVENLLSKLPIVGAPIQAGRQAAQQQFQSAVGQRSQDFQQGAINRVLGHVGETLDPATGLGNPAIAEMADKVGQAYQSAVPAAGAPLDSAAQSTINNAIANAKLSLPADRATQFENFVNGKILGQVQNGTLPGQAFKDAESDLGKEVRSAFSGNSTSDERKLGSAFGDLQGHLRDWLQRTNPASAADIAAANRAYREMLPVQYAAGGALDGSFTPMTLGTAARTIGGRTSFARGAAPMQDFAQDAADQQRALADLGATLRPGSGTGGHGAGAGMTGSLLMADLAERMLEHPHGPALAAAAIGYPLLAGIYSNGGRHLVNAGLDQAGGLLNQAAPLSPLFAAPTSGLLSFIR